MKIMTIDICMVAQLNITIAQIYSTCIPNLNHIALSNPEIFMHKLI